MENTWRCARCSHQNQAEAEACSKCQHVKPAPEGVTEGYEFHTSSSATPWIIGAAVFSLVVLIGLFWQRDASPVTTPVFASVTVSEPPPEVVAPVPVQSAPLNNIKPNSPGAVQTAKGEWHSVATFQGSGRQRTKPFFIRARHWRINWTTDAGTQLATQEREWYGPGSDFKADVYRNANEKIGVALNYQDQYSSILRLQGDGTYYADVQSLHNWTISVEEWR